MNLPAALCVTATMALVVAGSPARPVRHQHEVEALEALQVLRIVDAAEVAGALARGFVPYPAPIPYTTPVQYPTPYPAGGVPFFQHHNIPHPARNQFTFTPQPPPVGRYPYPAFVLQQHARPYVYHVYIRN